MDIPVSSSTTGKLRETYVTIEKHLRSLKALGENVDHSPVTFCFCYLVEASQNRYGSDGRIQGHGRRNGPWKASAKHSNGIFALKKLGADKLN